MKLSKYERETIITFNEEESAALIYTSNAKLKNRLTKFADKTNECVIEEFTDDGFGKYKIPKNWIKINMPRQYSEKQRQEMANRAKENLSKKEEMQI